MFKKSISLIPLVFFGFCGKKTSDTTDTTTTSGSTSVVLSGALNIASSATTLNQLTDYTTYSVSCITFKDTDPDTCVATIDSTGAFSKPCDNFVGQSFGCFLRNGTKVVGDLVFDSSTALTAGSGILHMNVNLDADTGLVSASIDKNKTTAPTGDEAAKSVAGSTAPTKTAFGKSMTGVWGIQQNDKGALTKEAKAANAEPDENRAPESIYFNQFDYNGKTTASIWSSEAAFQKCVNNNDEVAGVKLGFTINGVNIPFKASTLDEFNAMMDAVFGQLPATVQANIITFAKSQNSAINCDAAAKNLKSIDSVITDANVYFFEQKCTETKFVDPASGETKSRFICSLSKDDMKKGDLPTFTATVTSSDDCVDPKTFVPGAVNNKPVCTNPGDTKLISYKGPNGQNLMIGHPNVNAQNNDPNSLNYVIQPAPAATKAASITAIKARFNAGNQGPQGGSCKSITTGAFAGLYENSRDDIRRGISEMLNGLSDSDNGGSDGYCRNYAPLTSFSQCAGNKDKPSACYAIEQLSRLGVVLSSDNSKIVSSPSVDANNNWSMMYDQKTVKNLCPVVYASMQPSTTTTTTANTAATGTTAANTAPVPFTNAQYISFYNSCRTEFLAKPASDQIKMLEFFSYRPVGAYLLCSAETGAAALALLKPIFEKSCFPRVNNNSFCDANGTCQNTISCEGSPLESGACTDAKGLFVGQLPGRFETGTLELLYNNGFGISSVSQNSRYKYVNNKNTLCKELRSFVLKGTRISDDKFNATLTMGEKDTCNTNTTEGDSGSQTMDLIFSRK